jgi:hypothetical protein
MFILLCKLGFFIKNYEGETMMMKVEHPRRRQSNKQRQNNKNKQLTKEKNRYKRGKRGE